MWWSLRSLVVGEDSAFVIIVEEFGGSATIRDCGVGVLFGTLLWSWRSGSSHWHLLGRGLPEVFFFFV